MVYKKEVGRFHDDMVRKGKSKFSYPIELLNQKKLNNEGTSSFLPIIDFRPKYNNSPLKFPMHKVKSRVDGSNYTVLQISPQVFGCKQNINTTAPLLNRNSNRSNIRDHANKIKRKKPEIEYNEEFAIKTLLDNSSLNCHTSTVKGLKHWGFGAVSYTHLTLPTICSV
eukprot:TRINITY_DN2839_c0_g1_i5.p1 TRINITY_DN2839_c0_g1~~TRINITY_DN2839_c0_g1_i5.p1  ORF type:complete len:168 (+),score=15.75 TRINITY_DN2839_c0_g1_i5:108-611(+)